MKTLIRAALAAVMLAGPFSALGAAEREGLGDVYDICADTESKIQTQVLDPMLGQGRAYVFLEAGAELTSSSDRMSKKGVGKMHKGKAPGAKSGDDDASSEQMSSQEKTNSEGKRTFRIGLSGMKVRILHDASLPDKALKRVKEALLAIYPGAVKSRDIVFVPAVFAAEGPGADAE